MIALSEVLAKFPDLLKFESGERRTSIRCIETPLRAGENDIIFVSEARHFEEAQGSRSRLWVIKPSLAKDLPANWKGTLILSQNPYLAMALVAKEFFPSKPGAVPVDGQTIHPSAVISQTAHVGKNVKIGPGAVISDGVVLSDDVTIGANCVLEPGVKIGRRTHLHPLVFIGHSCEIGQEVEIKPNTTIGGQGFGFAHDEKSGHHQITHYGRVIIEDRVSIGSGVQIDRGTFEDSRIGEGTKIDNHCHFGHNFVTGKNNIFVAATLVAGSVRIGSNCVFGGRTCISGHLEIGDGVQLMALSGITKSLPGPGAFGGLPVQKLGDELKSRAVIPFLPKMKKQIFKIMKKLEMDAEQ